MSNYQKKMCSTDKKLSLEKFEIIYKGTDYLNNFVKGFI